MGLAVDEQAEGGERRTQLGGLAAGSGEQRVVCQLLEGLEEEEPHKRSNRVSKGRVGQHFFYLRRIKLLDVTVSPSRLTGALSGHSSEGRWRRKSCLEGPRTYTQLAAASSGTVRTS